MTRLDFINWMMTRKRWKDLLAILVQSLDDPSGPESQVNLPDDMFLLPVGAANHLQFLVDHGEHQKPFRNERNQFICGQPEAFQDWLDRGAPGLSDALIEKFLEQERTGGLRRFFRWLRS